MNGRGRVGRVGLRSVGLGVVACAAGALMLAGVVAAQDRAFDMDAFFRKVFLTREIRTKSVGPIRWVEGGEGLAAIEESESVKGAKDVVRYETATNKREVVLSAADLKVAGATGQVGAAGAGAPLIVENCDWSADGNLALIYSNSQRVWRANTRGDYWVFDRRTKKLRKLGGDAAPATLMFATFSPDGTRVAYVHANNIYVESATGGGVTQITKDGSATIINGTSDWVYEEELALRQAYRWSPDGKSIAYWQFDTAKVRNFALLYNVGGPYDVVTHIPYPQFGVYPVVKEIPYPQPGTMNSSVRVGVAPIAVGSNKAGSNRGGSNKGGETKWMQVPGDPSDNYIARMEWTEDSKALVLQHLNRLQNIDDVLWADAASGKVSQIYREQDAAWVDVFDEMQWIHGGKEFLWESEKDGWRHAYLVSRDGKARLLTAGNFDVVSILGITPKEDWLYFMASPENATERYLYRVRVDAAEGTAAKPERLTPAGAASAGTHAYNISPNFQWAVHTYSTFDSPPRVDLERMADSREVRVMEGNNELRAKLKEELPESQPAEFLRVRVGHDVDLDAWMIKPAGFDATKKYPVLVYVYGEPAAQTVMNMWEGDRDLFHRALAERGYVVVSFDNRGTPSPRGRDWRKVIYGKVGVLSSEEQTAAIRELAKRFPFVDGERVAIWGWSGGGSNTLNLMFRSPDVYKVGMSVAPVADQRLYDTIYQERYMGLPVQNTNGYKESSAINFAEGLRGNLLIVHSPGDDNVHYQGTELLVNRLVELGKPFDFMEYPGRTHGLSEGPGTYYHLYSLLARYLQEHLAAAR